MEKELSLLCKTEKDQKVVNFKVLKTIGKRIPPVTLFYGKSLERKFIYTAIEF